MNESADDLRARTAARSAFADGATAGVGSLPHHDSAAAAAFAIDEFDIATIPTMPHRSPVELMLGQALVGHEPAQQILALKTSKRRSAQPSSTSGRHWAFDTPLSPLGRGRRRWRLR